MAVGLFKDAVRDSVLRKVLIIVLNRQSNDTPLLRALLIGWDCLWIGPSHYVHFPSTAPGLCTNTKLVLRARTEQTARGP